MDAGNSELGRGGLIQINRYVQRQLQEGSRHKAVIPGIEHLEGRLGLLFSEGQHQDLPGIHQGLYPHGPGIGRNLLLPAEVAGKLAAGSVGELLSVSAGIIGRGGLVIAEMSIVPNAQHCQIQTARSGEDLIRVRRVFPGEEAAVFRPQVCCGQQLTLQLRSAAELLLAALKLSHPEDTGLVQVQLPFPIQPREFGKERRHGAPRGEGQHRAGLFFQELPDLLRRPTAAVLFLAYDSFHERSSIFKRFRGHTSPGEEAKMAIVIIRTLIIYFSLLLVLRLLGKRQLGEMELSEFVVAALIADLAAHPLQDMGIPLINGLIPILVLFCCEVLIAGLSLKSIRLRSLVFGKPSLLIVHGQILQREMYKNRFTLDELMQELRAKGITDLNTVSYGVLETNGKLSLILAPQESPLTPAQMGISSPTKGYPSMIISDGRVMEANLRHLGLDRAWLEGQLRKRGASSPRQVFLMTADENETVYYAAKEGTK